MPTSSAYFMNSGETTRRRGISATRRSPPIRRPRRQTPDVWIWSLAMSSFAKQKDAAWLFMQWAASTEHSLFGARKMDFVNPVRASVWKDSEFTQRPYREIISGLSRAA